MATKSEVFGDSESVPNAPPAYDAISTSAASAESVQCTRPSIFSFLWIKRTTRANVLSRVRNIVCAPDFSPSSVAQNVNDCAASLSAAEFSNLLQTCNIEDHTALYWAIVNKRREAFSALAGFISKYSSVCSSDLRLACMATSDHALFTSLNLGDNINPKDESLRRLLGCPSDEVQVHDEGDGLRKIQFVTRLRIRMFQKRLRTTQELGVEFVARGRIWLLTFSMGPPSRGKWRCGLSLSQDSFPAQPEALLAIEAHKGRPGCANPPPLRILNPNKSMLKPWDEYNRMSLYWPLSDWVMDDNTMYVDRDGTLHVKLEVTLA